MALPGRQVLNGSSTFVAAPQVTEIRSLQRHGGSVHGGEWGPVVKMVGGGWLWLRLGLVVSYG